MRPMAIRPTNSDQSSVVTSFYPIQFATERIAGGAIDVSVLTKPGAEPHDLEIAPQDLARMTHASLVVYSKGFQPAVDDAIDAIRAAEADWKVLQGEQDEIVKSTEAERGRSLRKNIAFEAELTRAKLVRDAVLASDGLEKAGHRPSGWWFPLVCPDGTWFRAMSRGAKFRLEPLT